MLLLSKPVILSDEVAGVQAAKHMEPHIQSDLVQTPPGE